MKRSGYFCLVLLMLLLVIRPSDAVMDSYDLQWRYIKNFVKYIQWSRESSITDVRFCILGQSPFARASGTLQLNKTMLSLKKLGKTTSARAAVVRLKIPMRRRD